MSEKRYILEPINLETRDLGDGQTAEYITGKGIVFNKWSQVLTAKRSDGKTIQFIELIEPRAIEGVDLSNVVSMVDHKITLGKRAKGTMDVTITADSVNYSVKVPNTTDGNNAKENIRNGNLEGSSFQFSMPAKGDTWDLTSTPYKRTIYQFDKVTEMGPVTYPAYIDTTAAMRSLEESEVIEERETDFKLLERKIKVLEVTGRAMVEVNDNTIEMLLDSTESECEYAKYSLIEAGLYEAANLCDLYSDALDMYSDLKKQKSKYLNDFLPIVQGIGQDAAKSLNGNAMFTDLQTKITQSIELLK
jgi:uncharacterized protein